MRTVVFYYRVIFGLCVFSSFHAIDQSAGHQHFPLPFGNFNAQRITFVLRHIDQCHMTRANGVNRIVDLQVVADDDPVVICRILKNQRQDPIVDQIVLMDKIGRAHV